MWVVQFHHNLCRTPDAPIIQSGDELFTDDCPAPAVRPLWRRRTVD